MVKIQKVIIIQDIKSLLDQEESFLRRADIMVFYAASNEEALEIHRAEKADLIIADLDAPVMDGEVLCSAIRERDDLRRVSLIIAHSGAASDLQRASRCRANAFMEKSADPLVLIETARQLMNIPVRETFRAPIGVKVQCISGVNTFLGYSENISVTGMLFDMERTLSKGEMLSCSFILPDSTHIRTDAEIVRIAGKGEEHDPNQYGIRFIELSTDFRAAIESYVRGRLGRS